MRRQPGPTEHADHDLRVERTLRLIREAVVELTLENGPSKLTVTSICRRAGINRSTFYRHYESKSDLLGRGMEEVLLELASSLTSLPTRQQELNFGNAAMLHNVRVFMDHIEKNRAFYRVMLGDAGQAGFRERFRETVRDLVLEVAAKSRLPVGTEAATTVPVDVIIEFMSGSLVTLVTWWVTDNPPYTAEEIMTHYFQLVFTGTGSVHSHFS